MTTPILAEQPLTEEEIREALTPQRLKDAAETCAVLADKTEETMGSQNSFVLLDRMGMIGEFRAVETACAELHSQIAGE